MGTVDIVLSILFILAGIRGAKKGFLEDVSQKFGYVFGFILAIMFTKAFASFFETNISLSPWLSTASAYVILFVAGYLLVKASGSLLKEACESNITVFLNSLLGFFLKVLEMMIICGALIQLLGHQSLIDLSSYFNSSVLNRKILSPLFSFLTSFSGK